MLTTDWLTELRNNVHIMFDAGNYQVPELLSALELLGVTVAAEPVDSVETLVSSADGQQTLWLARVWVTLDELGTSNRFRDVYVGHSSQDLISAAQAAVDNALNDIFCV